MLVCSWTLSVIRCMCGVQEGVQESVLDPKESQLLRMFLDVSRDGVTVDHGGLAQLIKVGPYFSLAPKERRPLINGGITTTDDPSSIDSPINTQP